MGRLTDSRSPTRWRWAQGKRRGRWRSTRAEAIEAAIAAGVVTRDEFTGNLYFDVFVSIEEATAAAG